MSVGTTPSLTLEMLLADPPRVHATAPAGVWATHTDCYEFLASTLVAGMATLETGLGISTLLFLLAGTRHTSVFLDPAEGEELLGYCEQKGIETGGLQLCPGYSDETLPALEPTPLDVVFLDGCHAFPFPQLDWFYTGSRLRKDGILVVDDLQLPAPFQLMSYLEADPRWLLLRRTAKWCAYARRSEGSLREEWRAQPSFGSAANQLKALKRSSQPKLALLARRALESARKRASGTGR